MVLHITKYFQVKVSYNLIKTSITRKKTLFFFLLKDKVISTKKQEVDNIVEQFNIQVNNPVCFLNQETSKHFLNSSNNSDKYKVKLNNESNQKF
jgi:hypothetical protein